MSERGSVHVFRASYTVPGPDGTRVLKRTKNYYWRFWYHGRFYSGGPGKKTQQEARALGEKRKGEVASGQEEDWRKLTMDGLYRIGQAPKVTWSEATQVHFECAWKRILRYLPPTMLVQYVDDDALLRFVAERKKDGGSQNTIRHDLALIAMAMRRAHGKRVLPFIPSFPRLKQVRREQTLAHVELEQILDKMPAHYHLLILAAEVMGWRTKSELRTRKWTHVEWGPPGWIVLEAQDSKTGERRVFPLTDRLRSILEAARARVEALQKTTGRIIPWVFCRDDGQQLSDYHKCWVRALRRLGIGKLEGRKGPWSNAVVVHDIRRSAIRRFELMGIPRSTSMGLVGHSEESTFSGYAGRGATPEALERARQMMDAADAVQDSRVESIKQR